MRGTKTGRRRALAALACLPLSACASGRAAVVEDPPPLLPPEEAAGALLLLIVPGLGLADVLLGAGQGDLPNLAGVLERGTLVEAIEPVDDALFTPGEMASTLVSDLECAFVTGACLNADDDLGLGRANCPPPGDADAALEAWLASLSEAVDQAEAHLGEADPGCRVLWLDGLLPLETGYQLVQPEQPDYDPEAALRYASLWSTAVRALDVSLGRLLRRADLADWTVALASTGEVWAVHSRLDPAEVLGPTTVLAGGAILESDGGLVLPEGEAWQQVRAGRAPGEGGGVRLLAPPGYAFASAEDALPRAVPQPGGFLLGLGRGLAAGDRIQTMAPESAADWLEDLQLGSGIGTEARAE